MVRTITPNAGTIKGTLNHVQAINLFNENAVLLGTRDGIPANVAARLFGAEIAQDILQCDSKKGYHNARSTSSGGLFHYLTFEGFLQAVTLHNIGVLDAGCTITDIKTKKQVRCPGEDLTEREANFLEAMRTAPPKVRGMVAKLLQK